MQLLFLQTQNRLELLCIYSGHHQSCATGDESLRLVIMGEGSMRLRYTLLPLPCSCISFAAGYQFANAAILLCKEVASSLPFRHLKGWFLFFETHYNLKFHRSIIDLENIIRCKPKNYSLTISNRPRKLLTASTSSVHSIV
jgi:hypothetical protein